MPLYFYLIVGIGLTVLSFFYHLLALPTLFFWSVLANILIKKFQKPKKTGIENLFENIDKVIQRKQ